MGPKFKVLLIELGIILVMMVTIVFIYRRFLTGDPTEKARVAHAKRLFGSAWRESMKYD